MHCYISMVQIYNIYASDLGIFICLYLCFCIAMFTCNGAICIGPISVLVHSGMILYCIAN